MGRLNAGLWYKNKYMHIHACKCICIYLFTLHLPAHMAPSDCEVRLLISKRTIEAPDKPITKSQNLAEAQQSARAAFMRGLLDVIAGRLCGWPPGINKASCPNTLLDTGSVVLEKKGGVILFLPWKQQQLRQRQQQQLQRLSHALPREVIFIPHDCLLTWNQYHSSNWEPLGATVSNSEGVSGMKLNKKYMYVCMHIYEYCLNLDKITN